MSNKLKLIIGIIIIILVGIVVAVNFLPGNAEISYTNNLFENEYIKVGSDGKFGVMDKDGNSIMPLKYDDIVIYNDSNFIAVKKGEKWGFSDYKGNLLINAKYDEVTQFSENNLSAVRIGSKWGYINTKGKEVIALKYDSASKFAENGIALVSIDSEYTYINNKGEKVLDVSYDELGEFSDSGYASVSKNAKYGVIDSNGKEVITPLYDTSVLFDNNGYAIVIKDDIYGVINKKGNEVIPTEYEYIIPTATIFNSKDLSSDFSSIIMRVFIEQLSGNFGVFDDRDVAIVVKDSLAGLINSKGDIIIEPQFNKLQVFHESDVVLAYDGLLYSYYDLKGNKLMNGYTFLETNGFYNDYAVVSSDLKWGFVDKNGKYIIEPTYKKALAFSKNGLAAVETDKGYGYINKKGEMVIEPKYKSASTFVENIAKVKTDSGWSLIKSDGTVVCNNISSEPELYSDGYAIAEESNGTYSIYDLNGNLVAKTNFTIVGNNHKSTLVCYDNGCYYNRVADSPFCEEHSK